MTPLTLFWLFTKTVALTFGGGYAVIPLFQYELVLRYNIIDNAGFANLLALAQLTPGPIGLNAATYTGYIAMGFPGAIIGTLGVALPCLILGTLGAICWHSLEKSRHIQNAMRGIRPMTLGLIISAVLLLTDSSIFTSPLKTLWEKPGELPQLCWQGALIFVIVLLVELKFKPNFILMLLASGLLGFLLFL